MVIWSPIYSCDYAAITQPLVLIKQSIEARLAQCLAHLPHLNLRLHAILAEDGAHVLSGRDDRFHFARGEVETLAADLVLKMDLTIGSKDTLEHGCLLARNCRPQDNRRADPAQHITLGNT